MGTVNNSIKDHASLLKECYELAEQIVSTDEAREVIRSRKRKVIASKDFKLASDNINYPNSFQQIVSSITSALAREGAAVAARESFSFQSELNALPDSADKEYLLALFSLRNGTNETQQVDALRHITVAISRSPNDPRYLALAEVLQAVDN